MEAFWILAGVGLVVFAFLAGTALVIWAINRGVTGWEKPGPNGGAYPLGQWREVKRTGRREA